MSKKLVLIKAWGYVDGEGVRFLLRNGRVSKPYNAIGEDEIEELRIANESREIWDGGSDWSGCVLRMIQSNRKAIRRDTTSEWDKKCLSWSSVLPMRARATKARKLAVGRSRSSFLHRQFKNKVRDIWEGLDFDWIRSIKVMQQRNKNAIKRQTGDWKWRIWCDTVAGNHTKRRHLKHERSANKNRQARRSQETA